MKKVVFLGLGYIGLPTAAVAAAHGFEVIGVDVNPSVVETINQGKIHIVEPELGQVVRDVVQSGKLRAVCKPEAADAFFIVVPTPFKQNHRADITYVEAATRSVIPYLQEGNLFVIESTSPVYTTERMAEVIYKERPELKGKIHIAYCPERVLPGNTLYELVHNDRRDVQTDGEFLPRLTDRLCQRTLHDLRQSRNQCMGTDRTGQQASACEYPSTGLRSRRSLYCGRPLVHRIRLSGTGAAHQACP